MHLFDAAVALRTLTFAATLAIASAASAHCDTPEGPVLPVVQRALETKDLTPALRWIKPEYEQEIRAAFAKAIEVRKSGGAPQEMADQYFAETFVRLHRAGEGEPYTGIKPAGGDPGDAVKAADEALKSGNDAALVKLITDSAAKAVQQRFARARQALAHADSSVEAGREYVDAYVAFVHFVEHLHTLTAETGQEVPDDGHTAGPTTPEAAHKPAAPAQAAHLTH